MNTKTARLSLDLIEAAEAEGAQQHRSTARQLEHWARFGMLFDRQVSASRRRIERVIVGDAPFDELTADELLIAHAQIDANIIARATSTSFADRLAAKGVTTVVMDADGKMVRREPNGTTSFL